MILAIDCGNTHTDFGCIQEDGEIVQIFCMESNRKKTSHEYAADIDEICTLLGIHVTDFKGAIISSGVPELTGSFREAAKQTALSSIKKMFLPFLFPHPPQRKSDRT